VPKVILLEFNTMETGTVPVTNFVLILFCKVLIVSSHCCSWSRFSAGSCNTLSRSDINNVILNKLSFSQRNATDMQFGRIQNYCVLQFLAKESSEE